MTLRKEPHKLPDYVRLTQSNPFTFLYLTSGCVFIRAAENTAEGYPRVLTGEWKQVPRGIQRRVFPVGFIHPLSSFIIFTVFHFIHLLSSMSAAVADV